AIRLGTGQELREGAEGIARLASVLDDSREGVRRLAAIAVGVVAIPIVKQDDGPGSESRPHPAADFRGSGQIRVPYPERPSERRVAKASRGLAHEWIPISVGSSERDRSAPGGVRDRPVRDVDLLADPAWPHEMELPMVLRVIADQMTGEHHSLGDP